MYGGALKSRPNASYHHIRACLGANEVIGSQCLSSHMPLKRQLLEHAWLRSAGYECLWGHMLAPTAYEATCWHLLQVPIRPHALKEALARARVDEVRKMCRIYACVCEFRCIGSHRLLKRQLQELALRQHAYLQCHPNATPVSARAAMSVFVLLY
jgi:hypothetical protein